jgi:hypothetical protein
MRLDVFINSGFRKLSHPYVQPWFEKEEEMIETIVPEDWEELWAQAVMKEDTINEHIKNAEDRITRTLEMLKAAKG